MLTKGAKIGLGVFFLLAMVYVIGLSVYQYHSFREYVEVQQPEMVYLQTDKGVQAVPKVDYDWANREWVEQHPYG